MSPTPRRVAQLALLVAVGIPASLITLRCLRFILMYSGPQFDVVIFNDHVVGGTEDKLAAWLLGTLSGAAAVFCGLRIWSILRAASSGER